MFATTTVDGHTAPTTFGHRNQPIPWLISAMNKSSVGPILSALINEYERAA
jgi:hypothetical protein